MSIEKMKQWLEALEGADSIIWSIRGITPDDICDAITSLRQAIEQHDKQKPVATLIEHLAFTDGIIRFFGVENMEQLPVGTEFYTIPQPLSAPAQKPVDWKRLYELEKKKKEAIYEKYERDIAKLPRIIPMEATPQQAEKQEPVAFITPLMEQQMFDDWCLYKGSPDPRVVWAAAVEAVNGLLLGATPPAAPVQGPVGVVYSVPVGQVVGPDDTLKFAHTVLSDDRLLLNQSLYTAPQQRERVVFPTMLRKMWSGGEVQAWLDENVNKEKNT